MVTVTEIEDAFLFDAIERRICLREIMGSSSLAL